ncbi:transglycosylase SLT domain-containing protein [Massilia sp. W12]|uniref:transglycosylase SLT domain-containing protein n=1 Tax=Massilia sp. W12 TaxID=3126507 RepID=UPI0030D07C66
MQKPFRILPLALLLSVTANAHANDLSLSPSSLQLKLATVESIAGMPNGETRPPQLVLDDELILPPVAPNVDVWERIRQGFAIPDLDTPLVKTHANWYAAHPDHIQRTSSRAARYLYHVVQELEKRGMPSELALLPFIESAFNPEAFSPASAAGIWQFIPSTGRDYNLKQNLFKDERRAVLASTEAALTYLQKLHGMFGDWQLALAAYNWGEGNVQRAIRRAHAAGKPIDFVTLSQYMPAETKNYVPRLQAVKNIIAQPEQFKLALPKVENQPYFTTVAKTRDIDVKLAAQLAEMPMDEFKALNPQFNRPVIVGSTQTEILLPQDKAEKFKVNLAQWGRALSSWTTHTITNAREKLETLAAKFSTTPEVLREANHIPPKMRLRAGSTILVPKTEALEAHDIAPEVADNARLVVEPDVDLRKISVRAGKRDSLASIAQRHKVSVADLRSWNSLKSDKLSAGQVLQLQVPAARASVATARQATPLRIAAAKRPAVRHAAPAKPRAVLAAKSNRHGRRS